MNRAEWRFLLIAVPVVFVVGFIVTKIITGQWL